MLDHLLGIQARHPTCRTDDETGKKVVADPFLYHVVRVRNLRADEDHVYEGRVVCHDQLARLEIVGAADVIADNSGNSGERDEEAEAVVDGFPAGPLCVCSVRDDEVNDGKPQKTQDERTHTKTHEAGDGEGRAPGDVEFTCCQRSSPRSSGRRSKSDSPAPPPESK